MAKILLIISLFLFVIGCGKSKSDDVNNEQPSYVPLSLEESKKLITPTIYYVPQYDQTKHDCSADQIISIVDKSKNRLAEVCAPFVKFCILQGTCRVLIENNFVLLRYGEIKEGEYIFSRVDEKVCPYGIGTRGICVDPFYSVAADLSIYKAGAVIQVPALMGILLPDGNLHSGYFIVRDSGGAIKGHGRFDFFTGFYNLNKSYNPLSKAGLAWKGTNLPYFIVEGAQAEEVLKLRHFPSVPDLK